LHEIAARFRLDIPEIQLNFSGAACRCNIEFTVGVCEIVCGPAAVVELGGGGGVGGNTGTGNSWKREREGNKIGNGAKA